MGATANRNKSQEMAADLVKRGIYHGKRLTSPHKNSGGTTMAMGVSGSSKNQRRLSK